MDDRIVARERPEHGLNRGKSGRGGEGGFLVRVQHPRSFASALLSFSAPSSDPEISLPLSIRTGCRERKRERKKERKNRLIRNTIIIYKKVHSMNTPNGTHCVIAHNFSRKGKQNYYRRTADCYRQIEFPPRSKFNRRIKRFVVHDSSTSSD